MRTPSSGFLRRVAFVLLSIALAFVAILMVWRRQLDTEVTRQLRAAVLTTLAAALLAGSYGLAMAQGGGGGGAGGSGAGADKSPASTGSDRNPTSGTAPRVAPIKQKNTGMPTATKDLGQETGTAKDSAGTSQMCSLYL